MTEFPRILPILSVRIKNLCVTDDWQFELSNMLFGAEAMCSGTIYQADHGFLKKKLFPWMDFLPFTIPEARSVNTPCSGWVLVFRVQQTLLGIDWTLWSCSEGTDVSEVFTTPLQIAEWCCQKIICGHFLGSLEACWIFLSFLRNYSCCSPLLTLTLPPLSQQGGLHFTASFLVIWSCLW